MKQVPTLYPSQFYAVPWSHVTRDCGWTPRELTPKERRARNIEVIRMLADDLDEWSLRRNPFG